MASLRWREAYQEILDVCAQSTLITGVTPLLLDEPVLKLRIHLQPSVFINIFVNVETDKVSFALIKEERRIFGVDNTRGWHVHSFDAPEEHQPCEVTSFESFLNQVAQQKGAWNS